MLIEGAKSSRRSKDPLISCNAYFWQLCRNAKVFVRPFLRHGPPLLLWLLDRLSRLHLSSYEHVPEPILQNVTFRFEKSQGFLKLIGQDKLHWRLGQTA